MRTESSLWKDCKDVARRRFNCNKNEHFLIKIIFTLRKKLTVKLCLNNKYYKFYSLFAECVKIVLRGANQSIRFN